MSRLSDWLDDRLDARRRLEVEEEPRLEWRPDAQQRLEAAGFQKHWRIRGGKAHGLWRSGKRVELDAEEFIEHFMVRR